MLTFAPVTFYVFSTFMTPWATLSGVWWKERTTVRWTPQESLGRRRLLNINKLWRVTQRSHGARSSTLTPSSLSKF